MSSPYMDALTGDCLCGCMAPHNGRQPSQYQTDILHFVGTQTGNAVVMACPGSGKTTTLEMTAYALPTNASAIFLAFGKDIATELSKRLPFPASTFHALCLKACRAYYTRKTGKQPPYGRNAQSWVQGRKTDQLIDTLYAQSIDTIRSSVVRLVSLARNNNLSPTANDDDIMVLVDRHDIETDDDDITPGEICTIVRTLLRAHLDTISSLDFDDMLYWVSQHNLRLEKYDYVMVDEAQDTNPIRLDIILRLLAPTSRVIIVGDECQAIYGFTGAMSDAMQAITAALTAATLPLSISYRCPRSIVELAARYGTIEPSPSAVDGTILHPTSTKLSDFRPNDLVLCRNTAPLVKLAYRLIAARIPAVIKGRDIGTNLVNLITRLAGKSTTLPNLPDKIVAYQQRETAKAYEQRNENLAQSIVDKCESILALIDSMTPGDRAKGVTGLTDIITSMFSDNDVAGKVRLSTMHRSKGLENPRVTILDWQLCPSKYAKTPEAQRQERNLQFVALTRSQDTLTFVTSDTIVS